MDTIADCHSRLTELLGSSTEPLDVLRRTEEHRSYWRPERVKVILLAESHVYTAPGELTRTTTLPVLEPPGLPSGFVRLVYCLGYGENQLLDRPIKAPSNSGTPQFWKIFYSCVNPVRANDDFVGIQSGVPLVDRIANKIAVLQRMRELGVWLVDTSLAALYQPGQIKPPAKILAACLQTSWDHHVGEVIKAAAPARLICIGKGVASALSDRLQPFSARLTVVAQPNARLTAAEHHQSFQTYNRVVREANALRLC